MINSVSTDVYNQLGLVKLHTVFFVVLVSLCYIVDS